MLHVKHSIAQNKDREARDDKTRRHLSQRTARAMGGVGGPGGVGSPGGVGGAGGTRSADDASGAVSHERGPRLARDTGPSSGSRRR